MTAALEGGEWSAARLSCTLPAGKDPVPILQEAGWGIASNKRANAQMASG